MFDIMAWERAEEFDAHGGMWSEVSKDGLINRALVRYDREHNCTCSFVGANFVEAGDHPYRIAIKCACIEVPVRYHRVILEGPLSHVAIGKVHVAADDPDRFAKKMEEEFNKHDHCVGPPADHSDLAPLDTGPSVEELLKRIAELEDTNEERVKRFQQWRDIYMTGIEQGPSAAAAAKPVRRRGYEVVCQGEEDGDIG